MRSYDHAMNHDLSLEHRESDLIEEMDRPDCDPVLLFNTYRQFQTLNRLISRWPLIFDALIAPIARRTKHKGRKLSVLDRRCGGGDVCLMMARRAARQELERRATGVEPRQPARTCARHLTSHERAHSPHHHP